MLSNNIVFKRILFNSGLKIQRTTYGNIFIYFFFQKISFDILGDNLHDVPKPIFQKKKK